MTITSNWVRILQSFQLVFDFQDIAHTALFMVTSEWNASRLERSLRRGWEWSCWHRWWPAMLANDKYWTYQTQRKPTDMLSYPDCNLMVANPSLCTNWFSNWSRWQSTFNTPSSHTIFHATSMSLSMSCMHALSYPLLVTPLPLHVLALISGLVFSLSLFHSQFRLLLLC